MKLRNEGLKCNIMCLLLCMSLGFAAISLSLWVQENAIPDDRLPYIWGGKSYNVIARSIEDDSEFVIGQCNFYE